LNHKKYIIFLKAKPKRTQLMRETISQFVDYYAGIMTDERLLELANITKLTPTQCFDCVAYEKRKRRKQN